MSLRPLLPRQSASRAPSEAQSSLNRSSSSRLRSAFTLVELLVVIAVIAILAAISVPAFGKAFQVVKSKKAAVVCNKLVQAIDAFENEWNLFPQDWTETIDGQKTDSDLLDPLMGNDTGINRTGERYFTETTTDQPFDGLYLKGGSPELYDPWSDDPKMYEFAVDANGDGEISRPSAYDSTTPIFRSSIVHSSGPDRDFNTPNDNPNSWGD